MAEEAKNQIPYVPFNTFNNAIEAMVTLPPRLDKGMWPSYSGAIQSQLWSAFKFFQLVNPDGTPTLALDTLVKDKANRKAHLKRLLDTYYPALMSLDLARATLGHFNEAMKSYGLGAETQKKASSFFLQAAKAAGMELSSYILSNTRTPGLKRTKRINTNRSKTQTVIPAAVPPPPAGNGPTRTIQLENGISLTLTASQDSFNMTTKDRNFVFKLLDEMQVFASGKDTAA